MRTAILWIIFYSWQRNLNTTVIIAICSCLLIILCSILSSFFIFCFLFIILVLWTLFLLTISILLLLLKLLYALGHIFTWHRMSVMYLIPITRIRSYLIIIDVTFLCTWNITLLFLKTWLIFLLFLFNLSWSIYYLFLLFINNRAIWKLRLVFFFLTKILRLECAIFYASISIFILSVLFICLW